MTQIEFGSQAARAVQEADRQHEQDRQEAPAKVVELGRRLDELAEESGRFEALYDELTTAWQALSSDPWLAEPLAMLTSYQEKARVKCLELEAAYSETAEALDHYAGLLDELDEGQLEAAHPESAAVIDRYAGLLDDLLESRLESTGR